MRALARRNLPRVDFGKLDPRTSQPSTTPPARRHELTDP